jgi:hypothetical protein
MIPLSQKLEQLSLTTSRHLDQTVTEAAFASRREVSGRSAATDAGRCEVDVIVTVVERSIMRNLIGTIRDGIQRILQREQLPRRLLRNV